jgi:coenzyme F420-reducing hydrogenase beta subunit
MELFRKKENCCACEACKSVCPKSAITLKSDDYGSYYPYIDEGLCIECGLCMKVCSFQNGFLSNRPKEVLVAINKSLETIRKSSSGGVFPIIAEEILELGGKVYGSVFDENNEVCHIGISEKKDIKKMQGSKYVRSEIRSTFIDIEQDLKHGRYVFFSGTPCQVGGLISFLRKDYEKLYTADLICHGVPGKKIFDDYLNDLEKELNGNINEFIFRDESGGWGILSKAKYTSKGRQKVKFITSIESVYLNYFLKGVNLRPNCYICPYAQEKRVADFTIGDYWGIEAEHPELIRDEKINILNGVSVIMMNTKKATDFKLNLSKKAQLFPSTYSKAVRKNPQLMKPTKSPESREFRMEIYKKNGIDGLKCFYHKEQGLAIYAAKMKSLLPRDLITYLKKIRKRLNLSK